MTATTGYEIVVDSKSVAYVAKVLHPPRVHRSWLVPNPLVEFNGNIAFVRNQIAFGLQASIKIVKVPFSSSSHFDGEGKLARDAGNSVISRVGPSDSTGKYKLAASFKELSPTIV